MAKDNPTWGYDRIQGALQNIGHAVAPTTIRNILRRRGLEPAPLRSSGRWLIDDSVIPLRKMVQGWLAHLRLATPIRRSRLGR